MFKRISAICLMIVMIASVAVPIGLSANGAGDLSTAAVREYTVPPDGIVIIDPELVALAGEAIPSNPQCDVVLAAINAQRSAAGLSALNKTGDLATAAYIRAKEQEQLFSHTRPNGSDWWTVNSSVCFGECLSKGYSADSVTIAWMNSPAHKAVIMDGSYKTAGIGIYQAGDGTIYIALETGY